MIYLDDEKDKKYYIETFKIEANQQLAFFKKGIENHQKNIKRLTGEIEEETSAIGELQGQVNVINNKLSNEDEQAKKMLFRDFRSAINRILNGDESQPGARFGLRVEKKGPYRVEKPVSVSQDGKKITESRSVLVTKIRTNETALGKFRDYLRTAGNIPIDNLTFDELKKTIEKFFGDAPKFDSYDEAYESETFAEPEKVVTGDALFKI